MVIGLAATSHSTPSQDLRLAQYQAQLMQARRAADDAAAEVRELEAKTEVARVESVNADERLGTLESQRPGDKSDSPAPRTKQPINSFGELKGTLLDVTA